MGNLKDVQDSTHFNGAIHKTKLTQLLNSLTKLDQMFRNFWQHTCMGTISLILCGNRMKKGPLLYLCFCAVSAQAELEINGLTNEPAGMVCAYVTLQGMGAGQAAPSH